MHNLQVFRYNSNAVRTVIHSDEPWWVLKDVCEALGIENPSYVKGRLDKDEVGSFDLPHPQNNLKTLEMVCVNEPGLYNVILRSDKPEAKQFKRWVTHEVLPSIRRTGMYATAEAAERLLNDPDFLIGALEEIKAVRARNAALTETVHAQQAQIAEMQPKASYYDVVLNCKNAVAITVIAKDYGKSGQWLNERLHNLGVQFKKGNIWLLYQKYAEKGYTCTKTHSYLVEKDEVHSRVHTYWTQKGRLFIYELLKSGGCLPLIEAGADATEGGG
jgi:prophage antirepressor-like protein